MDDTFLKDNFDITGIEDNIYNQMAKTMARNVDIELAKTPLVDILTGYTRYKEAEYELQQKEKIIKEVREYIENDMKLKDNFMIDEDGAKYLLEILDKENK